jgi:hypothetical protein
MTGFHFVIFVPFVAIASSLPSYISLTIWVCELNLLEYPHAPVAQWIEHRTSNPMVVGPIPAGGANILIHENLGKYT